MPWEKTPRQSGGISKRSKLRELKELLGNAERIDFIVLRTKGGYWRQMNGWEQAEELVGYTQVWIEESIHRNALM